MTAAAILAISAAGFWLFGGSDYDCPGSAAAVHASCKVTAALPTSCDAVRAEMLARVKGQFDDWHDPHNNGTYAVVDDSGSGKLSFTRLTGDRKYTDKMILTLEGRKDSCLVRGCSESQVTSVLDFSTNFCNLRMLYCGADDGCKTLTAGYPGSASEKEVKPSTGAGTEPSACFHTRPQQPARE